MGRLKYLEDIDHTAAGFGELYDELPLWSAPFGLLLLERFPVKPAITVLDVGAGTGFLTVELAQRCGPSATVIAVDPWKSGMARLARKISHVGLENIRLIEQDAALLDLPDGSVDVVVSNLGLNNFENAQEVLRTCFRVSRPGGRLLLTTNLVGHMNEFYDVYRATLIELGRRDRLEALEAHVAHRGTVDSVGRLLNGAGFEVLETTTESFRMRFADGTSLLRHYFVRLGFLPGWKSVVAAHEIEKTFDALERNLNARAAEKGELALTIPIACVEARKSERPGSGPPA
jgi:ubiquinone/menaquinone biosynthesis C-methylase UbiE